MEPIAYISAAICAVSMVVAAWGVTKLWTTMIETVGRNPQVKKRSRYLRLGRLCRY